MCTIMFDVEHGWEGAFSALDVIEFSILVLLLN